MEDDITGLDLTQLRLTVQQAALPADRQMARLKGYDVPSEIADDFDNWCRWALGSTDLQLTTEQRSCLAALNLRLSKMSGEHNAILWDIDSLQHRMEWEEVRRDAHKILRAFHWPAAEDAEADN